MRSIYIITLLTTAILFAPRGMADNTGGPANLSIRFELFSMPTLEAAKMMRVSPSDIDTYNHLATEGRQEAVTVITGRSGAKISSESVSEHIYPTEYIPAKLPDTICIHHGKDQDGKKDDLKNLAEIATPATARAFETRSLGLILQVEATLGSKWKWCDMRVRAEMVSHVGEIKYGNGLGTTTLPKFETQRISNASTCEIGKPRLLGTMSKPPFSEKGEGLQDRVWFAMMTVTLVK